MFAKATSVEYSNYRLMNDELRALAICILLAAVTIAAMSVAGLVLIIRDFIANPGETAFILVGVAIGIAIATLMDFELRNSSSRRFFT